MELPNGRDQQNDHALGIRGLFHADPSEYREAHATAGQRITFICMIMSTNIQFQGLISIQIDRFCSVLSRKQSGNHTSFAQTAFIRIPCYTPLEIKNSLRIFSEKMPLYRSTYLIF
jgi:hypothetical protein